MVNPMIASIEIISHDGYYYEANIRMTNSEKYNAIILSQPHLDRLIDTHRPQIVDSRPFEMGEISRALARIAAHRDQGQAPGPPM
jgi:hypothetical protein